MKDALMWGASLALHWKIAAMVALEVAVLIFLWRTGFFRKWFSDRKDEE